MVIAAAPASGAAGRVAGSGAERSLDSGCCAVFCPVHRAALSLQLAGALQMQLKRRSFRDPPQACGGFFIAAAGHGVPEVPAAAVFGSSTAKTGRPMNTPSKHSGTLALHGGYRAEPPTGAIPGPIYPTTSVPL